MLPVSHKAPPNSAWQRDPSISSMPKFEQVVKGIKSHQAKQAPGPSSRTRLPITPTILKKIRSVLSQNSSDFMIWAACCLCYFRFLRSGEICVPSLSGYDTGAHLSHGDIAVDNQNNPTLLAVTIKTSKTAPSEKVCKYSQDAPVASAAPSQQSHHS